MNQNDFAEILLTTTIIAILFAAGRIIYIKFFASPVSDFTAHADDLGEDSPVIEALLKMRERYLQEGNHAKALEYSAKALKRCPESDRI
ncbi:MAG: hypothetical protein JNL52_03505 [Flavobacteriales bacterium]|nr:hypothetical protein [Flavobacteriales bacterium]